MAGDSHRGSRQTDRDSDTNTAATPEWVAHGAGRPGRLESTGSAPESLEMMADQADYLKIGPRRLCKQLEPPAGATRFEGFSWS